MDNFTPILDLGLFETLPLIFATIQANFKSFSHPLPNSFRQYEVTLDFQVFEDLCPSIAVCLQNMIKIPATRKSYRNTELEAPLNKLTLRWQMIIIGIF